MEFRTSVVAKGEETNLSVKAKWGSLKSRIGKPPPSDQRSSLVPPPLRGGDEGGIGEEIKTILNNHLDSKPF